MVKVKAWIIYGFTYWISVFSWNETLVTFWFGTSQSPSNVVSFGPIIVPAENRICVCLQFFPTFQYRVKGKLCIISKWTNLNVSEAGVWGSIYFFNYGTYWSFHLSDTAFCPFQYDAPCKGPFNNYVDKNLTFFEYLPP